MDKDFEAVVLSACRTPIGAFGGAFKDVSAVDLGTVAIREAIARAFPVVVALFGQLHEEPANHLCESWKPMLDVKAVFDRELAECDASFEKVDWESHAVSNASRVFCWSRSGRSICLYEHMAICSIA